MRGENAPPQNKTKENIMKQRHNYDGADKCREWLKEHLKDREHYATTDKEGKRYTVETCPALLSDVDLARMFKICQSTVGKIRNEERIPSRDVRAAKMREDFAAYMEDVRYLRRPRHNAMKRPSKTSVCGFVLGVLVALIVAAVAWICL
jgi:hypothetical protein